MPFCTHCGGAVQPTDLYCANCGARQAASPGPASSARGTLLEGISPRTASMLCYVPFLGWLAAILVLASARFERDQAVRFHAFQGLYLFVVWLIADWVVAPLLGPHVPSRRVIEGILKLSVFAAWIFMLMKTSQNQTYRLPILGELAERSLTEQR